MESITAIDSSFIGSREPVEKDQSTVSTSKPPLIAGSALVKKSKLEDPWVRLFFQNLAITVGLIFGPWVIKSYEAADTSNTLAIQAQKYNEMMDQQAQASSDQANKAASQQASLMSQQASLTYDQVLLANQKAILANQLAVLANQLTLLSTCYPIVLEYETGQLEYNKYTYACGLNLSALHILDLASSASILILAATSTPRAFPTGTLPVLYATTSFTSIPEPIPSTIAPSATPPSSLPPEKSLSTLPASAPPSSTTSGTTTTTTVFPSDSTASTSPPAPSMAQRRPQQQALPQAWSFP
ncbi:MAG: hypothetical protein MMC33_002727 [Icmadophila ericetorum]|nr:hypothetical protein [Icmadophila ericetorum]